MALRSAALVGCPRAIRRSKLGSHRAIACAARPTGKRWNRGRVSWGSTSPRAIKPSREDGCWDGGPRSAERGGTGRLWEAQDPGSAVGGLGAVQKTLPYAVRRLPVTTAAGMPGSDFCSGTEMDDVRLLVQHRRRRPPTTGDRRTESWQISSPGRRLACLAPRDFAAVWHHSHRSIQCYLQLRVFLARDAEATYVETRRVLSHLHVDDHPSTHTRPHKELCPF